MKKTIIFSILFAISAIGFTQAPNGFNYQAIVRNSLGDPLVTQLVRLRISLLRANTLGTQSYQESHLTTTNPFGLVNVVIGNGSSKVGLMDTINWSSTNYFIKIEVDITGGATFVDVGTTQLQSVPYALYAGSSNNNNWENNGSDIYNSNVGNVGVGTNTPNSKLEVKGTSFLPSDTLFQVKDANGNPVFIVMPDGVHVIVPDDGSKATVGGFAVSGRSTNKGPTSEYMIITPDSARIYVKENGSKATVGGFAVSGRSTNKDFSNEYLRVTSDSTRVYTGDSLKGFGVSNIGSSSKSHYMQMNPNNYFIGHEAGKSNTTGLYNSFIGYQSGFNNSIGSKNYFIGYKSGFSNNIGNSNIFIGDSTGYSNDLGAYNVFIGNQSGFSNLNGAFNVGSGYQSLYYNTIGGYNIGIGYQSLFKNTEGNSNVASGFQALHNNTTGYSNAAIGFQALYSNTTGYMNVANGNQALFSNINGCFNTANGYKALYSDTVGSMNVATGYVALYSNTIGEFNTANGFMALYANDDGTYNVAVGSSALQGNTHGSANVAIGPRALHDNSIGSYNVANGYNALSLNKSGHFNVASGFLALTANLVSNNTAYGAYSLMSDTTGSDNTALGYMAFNQGGNFSNSTALGAGTSITASNQVRLGSSSVTDIGGFANWTNASDKRFKKDISENVFGLEFILKLRPVTYYYDMDKIASLLHTPDSIRLKDAERAKGNILQTGLIAQEVEEAAQKIGYNFSGVSKPQNSNDFYGLKYAEFTVPLIKAVQELNEKILVLEKENASLKTYIQEINILKSEIERLKNK